MRSYGAIWGVAVPAAVFNNIFSKNIWKITDPAIRAALSGWNAYVNATKAFVISFPKASQSEIMEVYTDALRISWAIGAAVAGFGMLFTLFEINYSLRESLRAKFSVKEGKKWADTEAVLDK